MIDTVYTSSLKTTLDYVDAHPEALLSPEFDFFKTWLVKRGCVIGIESDDEEDEPPPDIEGANEAMEKARSKNGADRIPHYNDAIALDPTQSRRFAERGEVHLELNDYESAKRDVDRALELKPDSVKSLRLRANIAWMENDVKLAYFTMCEAQQIDYSDEWDPMHRQMKTAFEEAGVDGQSAPPPPTNLPNSGIDMNAFMQSPAVQEMAKNLMNNPALMQQMMGTFNKSAQ